MVPDSQWSVKFHCGMEIGGLHGICCWTGFMEYANGHLVWPGRVMMVFNGNHDAQGVITEAEVMQRAHKRNVTAGWREQ